MLVADLEDERWRFGCVEHVQAGVVRREADEGHVLPGVGAQD